MGNNKTAEGVEQKYKGRRMNVVDFPNMKLKGGEKHG
jgi:hypothetical protein